MDEEKEWEKDLTHLIKDPDCHDLAIGMVRALLDKKRNDTLKEVKKVRKDIILKRREVRRKTTYQESYKRGLIGALSYSEKKIKELLFETEK